MRGTIQLADTGNEVDLAAWLCTVPGIPLWWAAARVPDEPAHAAVVVSFHGEGANT